MNVEVEEHPTPGPMAPQIANGVNHGSASLPACPVCAGTCWSPPAFGTHLRECLKCGTVFNDRSSGRHQEEQLYDHCASVPVRDQDDVANSQWKWVRDLVEVNRDRPLRVLDIGCGSGAFLQAAKRDGARVAGLELDPVGLKESRSAGLEVIGGSIFDVDLPVGPWDVITFWDVLDHLETPDAALRVAAAHLAPGGLLVLRGRNARIHAPLKRLLRKRRFLTTRLGIPDVSVVHRWGFGPSGWLRLLEASGIDNAKLYPGLPTPGNRYATASPRFLFALLKGAFQVFGAVAFRMTAGGIYPYPTVLVVGRSSSD